MKNEVFLKFLCTVEEYLAVNHSAEEKKWPATRFDEYWEILPVYGIAKCPYCGEICRELVDTYSLRNWKLAGAEGKSVFIYRASQKVCEHFVVTQPFINLNGIKPNTESATELKTI